MVKFKKAKTAAALMAAALAALLLLGGCSGGKDAAKAEIDPEKLGQELYDSGCFGQDIFEVDSGVIESMYGELEGVQAAKVYASSGASANEIAVFRAADKAGAEKIYQAASQRLEDRKLAYENYLPEEAKKLESALLRQEGSCVVFCVAEDAPGAEKIVDSYFD